MTTENEEILWSNTVVQLLLWFASPQNDPQNTTSQKNNPLAGNDPQENPTTPDWASLIVIWDH